jgi:hypothetical protein
VGLHNKIISLIEQSIVIFDSIISKNQQALSIGMERILVLQRAQLNKIISAHNTVMIVIRDRVDICERNIYILKNSLDSLRDQIIAQSVVDISPLLDALQDISQTIPLVGNQALSFILATDGVSSDIPVGFLDDSYLFVNQFNLRIT